MNDDGLFSAHWFRIQAIKPRLAGDVESTRHIYRGIPSYVLHRRSTNAYYRLDCAAFELINKFDGSRSVADIWNAAIANQGVTAPTQTQFLHLLGHLHEAELLTVNRKLDAERLFNRGTEQVSHESQQRYTNPLFLRFRLTNPDKILSRLLPLAHFIFNRTGLLAWLGLIVIALFTLAPQLSELKQEISRVDFLSPEYAALSLVIYPLLKLLHELAHGLALKRFGGDVRELGIALMVLLPVPYVDASSAAVLSNKYHRMLISGAGIFAELAMAAIATLVWVASDGTLHDIALLLMLLGGLSTLLFNANPLLKFDGYYLLADAIEIPNLADRSRRYILELLQRYALGFDTAQVATHDRAERIWLVSYGVLSTLYRIGLMLGIAYMLSDEYFFFGAALALWVLISLVGMPLWRLIVFLTNLPQAKHTRAWISMVVVVTVVSLALIRLPVPLNTITNGVVWLPDNAIVRVEGDCEITQTLSEPGAHVTEGTPLFYCEDLKLGTEVRVLQAKLDEFTAMTAGLDHSDPVKSKVLKGQINTAAKQLQHLQKLVEEQLVVADTNGQFLVSGNTQLTGRFLRPETVAAYVVPANERTIRVAITETEIDHLINDVQSVEMRFVEQLGVRQTYHTTVQRQTPAATRQLPSLALTRIGGGQLDVESEQKPTLLQPIFDIELAWPEQAPQLNVGSHVRVKFIHTPQPIVDRLLSGIRRAFMRRVSA